MGILNVGIVGFGYAAQTFHAPLISACDAMRLSHIVSSNPDLVAKSYPNVAIFSTPQAMFDDNGVDLVVIATPNATHYPLALAALRAGKAVVVDKPFTLRAIEARHLMDEAKVRGLFLSVFHNRRWDSDFLTVKRVMASGELGEIVHFESHFDRFRPQVRDRWREADVAGAGLWYDLGPHLLDQALCLFGKPDAVHLVRARQREGAKADDWFHCVMSYAQTRVILHASTLVAAPNPRFIIHGKMGSLVKTGLDPQEDALKRGEVPGGAVWGIDPNPAHIYRMRDAQSLKTACASEQGDYPAYYKAVHRAMTEGAPNPVTPEEAISVMEIIERV